MNSYVLLGLTSIIFLLLLTILKRKFSLNTDLYLILAITVTYSLFAFYRLGSHELCTTYYQPTSVNEEIILELDDDIPYFNTIRAISSEGNNNNKDSYQIYYNDIEVYGSNNLSDYDYLLTLDSRDFIKYNTFYTSGEYRYIKLVFTDTDSIINELAFYNDDKLLDVSIYQSGNDLLFNPENLIDEQEIIPLESTYYDETFFDEIYHVRNALEIASGSRMYASVHPLLGTVMISLGIRIFGLDPFGFRFFGTLFSILMIPLTYLLARKMFRNTFISAFAAILLASDFMHFTTGRIGTLEPFSIFTIILMYYFMYSYLSIKTKNKNSRKLYKYLYLTSLAMSLSWAVKWTGLYATMGIVILYFLKILREYSKENRSLIIRILLLSVLFYVIQPLVVYVFVYSLTNFNGTPAHSLPELVKNVWNYTVGIYNYHHNLDATHPFQSVWYQWIFDIRPIWYYYSNHDGIISTISCFNNPLVAVGGFFSILYCFYDTIRNRSRAALFISVGYLAELLPWIPVTRCVFSYHYYPSLIFLVLALAYVADKMIRTDIRYKKPLAIFAVACIILFLLFLPVISGLPTTAEYIDGVLRWLQSWVFYV